MNKDNFFAKRPKIKKGLLWNVDTNGIVTLKIENRNIVSKLFKKIKYSFVHLDELGSFVWTQLDGESNVYEIGKRAEERFGEKTAPLFERLIKYLKILESYKFIYWVK